MNELHPDGPRAIPSRLDEACALRQALAAVWRITTARTRQQAQREAVGALRRLNTASVICLDATRSGRLDSQPSASAGDVAPPILEQVADRLTDGWQPEDGPSLVSLEQGRIVAMHCTDMHSLRGGLALIAPAGERVATAVHAALAVIALTLGNTLGALAMRATSVPLDRHEAALAGQRAELSHTLHAGPAQDLAMASMALEHLLSPSRDAGCSNCNATRVALAYVGLAGENLRQFMARLRGEAIGETPFHEPARGSDSFFPGIGQEEAILAIVREAIRNSRAHARADEVSVSVTRRGGDLSVQIRDDGRGFSGPAPAGHFGLAEMRELTESLGGEIEIASTPGTGTTITFTVPKPSDDPTGNNGNCRR